MASLMTGASLPVPSRSLLRFLRSAALPGTGRSCPATHRKFGSSQANPRRKHSTSSPRLTITPPILAASLGSPARISPRPSHSTPLLARPTPPNRRRFSIKPSPPKAKDAVDQTQSDGKSWQEKLWGFTARRGAKPLRPDDLPGHHENCDEPSMFHSRRTMAAKAALEPRLRCTEVDETGNVIMVDGEFKKTELIAKYGLLPRDLRKIDSSNLPHILTRPSAILLNLLHLKVLIKHDRVLLFDVYGSKTSYPQSAFLYDLQRKLQQKNQEGGLTYEFRALEAVLTSVTSELEADFEAVREPVMRILSELEDDIDRQKLRVLLILSKRVSSFEQKAKLVRDAIDELLEADDDLADMYLTEKAHDIMRGLDDHTEVEMLLESYHKLADEIVQEAGSLVSGIRNTEEIVRAILDANRNALMLLDLKFSVGTLGLAMGTFLAGLYGMNLENFIEETNWGFSAVTGSSMFFSLVVCWYGLVKLRKVQRIKMMSGDRPNLPRGQMYSGWDDGALGGLLDARSRERLRMMHVQKSVHPKRRWWCFW